MNKLLWANLMRLKKNRYFLIGLALTLVSGMFISIMRYVDMKQTGSTNNLDSGFFYCVLIITIILSLFCSLFVGTDYSDGTIRNKLIIGHKRMNIYLANVLVNMFAALIMFILFAVVYMCIGVPLLGFFQTDIKVIMFFIVTVIILLFAFASIFTMIAMINSNRSVVVGVCILSAFLLIIVGVYFCGRLDAPEKIPDFSYELNGEAQWESETKNPHYIEGTEREIYQFLYDFLPGGQVIQCTSMEAKNMYMLPLYSAIIVITTTFSGVIIFKKKDIK